MKQYRYIGYYNDNADIKDIIESYGWNDPELIAGYYEGGYGNFHKSDSEDIMSVSDVNNENIFLSTNRQYIVKFSEGAGMDALDKDEQESNAGYFVDIWELEEEESFDLSDDALKKMADLRHRQDMAIKSAIKDEFKAAFTKPGTGLDFYEYAGETVYGMLDETGEIGRMFLNSGGEIQVTLIQEYDEPVEDFESRYFSCDDWPTLLYMVRKGIREEWFLEDDDDEDE